MLVNFEERLFNVKKGGTVKPSLSKARNRKTGPD